jgi:hypothetical protein
MTSRQGEVMELTIQEKKDIVIALATTQDMYNLRVTLGDTDMQDYVDRLGMLILKLGDENG